MWLALVVIFACTGVDADTTETDSTTDTEPDPTDGCRWLRCGGTRPHSATSTGDTGTP